MRLAHRMLPPGTPPPPPKTNCAVVPRDSAWFSWWSEDGSEMVGMRETPLYKEDWIGLKTLDKVRGRGCALHAPPVFKSERGGGARVRI